MEKNQAFPASDEQLFSQSASQDKGTSQRNLIQSTSKARQDDHKATPFEELNSKHQTFNPEKCCLPQPKNIESGSGMDGRSVSATTNANQTTEKKKTISVADPTEAIVNDKQGTNISAIPVEQVVDISTAAVIVLSDSDEEDTSRRKAVENPDINIWHCLGPYGERRGPYSMSVLKRWSESASSPLEFKVWKTGQSEKEAVLLTDALSRIFPSM